MTFRNHLYNVLIFSLRSMLPDVVDEAAANVSTVRREELFYAFFVFGNKLATGVTLGISTGIYKYVEPAHDTVKPS